jgi:hypothetical protein
MFPSSLREFSRKNICGIHFRKWGKQTTTTTIRIKMQYKRKRISTDCDNKKNKVKREQKKNPHQTWWFDKIQPKEMKNS